MLIQSVLMILFQLVLLEACLRYRDGPPSSPSQPRAVPPTPAPDPDGEGASLVREPEEDDVAPPEAMAGPLGTGPLGATAGHTPHVPTLRRRILGSFWGWQDYGSYLEFLALLIASHAVLLVILWGVVGWDWYIQLLGILALGLESTVSRLLVARGRDADLCAAADTSARDQLAAQIARRLPDDRPRRLDLWRRVQDRLCAMPTPLRLGSS